jgi:hypothetical protein
LGHQVRRGGRVGQTPKTQTRKVTDKTRFHAPSYTLAETVSVTRAMPSQSARPVKRFMATVTAGVTALSMLVATAIPAHADRASDNLAKALVGALVIGAIVNSANRGHAQPAPPVEAPVQVRHPRVPSACAIEISGKRRDVTVYPERCLRREGFDARLPRACAFEARIFGRPDRVYGEDCLRDAGYRVGGRSNGYGNGRDDRYYRDDRDWNNHGGRRFNH